MPLHVVLARTADGLIAATHISVYPNGLAFQVEGLLRLPPRERDRHEILGAADPRTMLRIGPLFADGRRVTNLGDGWPTGDDPVVGPVLVGRGGGSGDRSCHHGYWTWPAPPPGPIELVAEWPAAAVPEGRAVIGAELWRRLARGSRRSGPALAAGSHPSYATGIGWPHPADRPTVTI